MQGEGREKDAGSCRGRAINNNASVPPARRRDGPQEAARGKDPGLSALLAGGHLSCPRRGRRRGRRGHTDSGLAWWFSPSCSSPSRHLLLPFAPSLHLMHHMIDTTKAASLTLKKPPLIDHRPRTQDADLAISLQIYQEQHTRIFLHDCTESVNWFDL